MRLIDGKKLRNTMTMLYESQKEEGEILIHAMKKDSGLKDEDFEKKLEHATSLIKKGTPLISLIFEKLIHEGKQFNLMCLLPVMVPQRGRMYAFICYFFFIW